MNEKVVYEVAVKSKNIFTDGLQWARNVFGKNLPAFENMIKDSIQEALDKLQKKYPEVYDIRICTSMVALGASEIIVYGKIKCQ